MDLKKQIAVLAWKMKYCLLVTTGRKISSLLAGLVLLAPALVLAADTLPYYNDEDFTPQWIETTDPMLQDFHQIPDFSFVNQEGEIVTQKTFKDKIYVAGFFFSTCPGICPSVRSKLMKIQETFIDDPSVAIMQHSIRPSSDTVEILKAYADENGIESHKWHLVTGDKDTIYALAKSAYFASEDLGNIQNTNDFLHTESILLIDSNRHIRGIYNGLNSASMGYLVKDIKILITESRKSKL